MKYPPFCDIIVIGFNSTNETEIKKVSQYMYELLGKNLDKNKFQIFKPMPCPVDKIQNKYRWRIIIKGKIDEKSNSILNKALHEIYSKQLKNTKVYIDINPNNMM